MPALISFKDQELLATLLSAIFKCTPGKREDQAKLAELCPRVFFAAKIFLAREYTDLQLATQDLLEHYKLQLLTEITQAQDAHVLGEIMQRAPAAWGKLPLYAEIFKAIIVKNEVFKEQKYIVGMDSEERSSYISNADHHPNTQQAAWARAHQAQVAKLLLPYIGTFDNLQVAELLAKSSEISNYLLRNSHAVNVAKEPRPKLSAVEYSLYVELHQLLRTKLVQNYAQQLVAIRSFSKDQQLQAFCTLRSDLKQRINAEYININSYNVSEHLQTLIKCLDLVSAARQQANIKPQLAIVGYMHSRAPAATSAVVTNSARDQCVAQAAKLRYG